MSVEVENLVGSFKYAAMALGLAKIAEGGFTELQQTSQPAFETAVGYASCTGVALFACVLGAGAVDKLLKPKV